MVAQLLAPSEYCHPEVWRQRSAVEESRKLLWVTADISAVRQQQDDDF